ncbi:MAG: beta-ketoacyl-ACP synthase II [bacterium]
MNKKRVVVTGLGSVNPIANTVEETWALLLNGECGIDSISRFDPSKYEVRIAGEVKGFNPEHYIEKRDIKKMSLFIQYAMASTMMAYKDSGLSEHDVKKERIGVIIGSGMGGLESIEYYHDMLLSNGSRKISPFFIPMTIGNMASGYIAIKLGAMGPNLCITTACASGAHSIGEAYRYIQNDLADVMIAGGAESTITPLALVGFSNMKALSTRNDDPKHASRPFDLNRDGFVMGEGAGVLILESYEHAKSRGAKIYAELVGYGANGDAYHITAPSPGGEGAVQCMNLAIRDAGISPEQVDYINAHGTSTKYNDQVETLAIKTVFSEHAYKLVVSSTKGATGHLLGAAGAIEAIFTVMALHKGIIPPTINYQTPDPECDLNYVPNVPLNKDIKIAMSNSFGFGGTNAVLIFRKAED